MFKKASKLFSRTDKDKENSSKEVSEAEVLGVYIEPFFYGRITRQEAEDVLKVNGNADGLYLLRESFTPMGNFSLSISHNGEAIHYAILKQIDGKFQISDGVAFSDPVSLIEHYRSSKKGFLTVPKTPCLRIPPQEAIACRGLSYTELHSRMKTAAQKMNANIAKAFGPLREPLLVHVLKTIHKDMPWFHGEISRDEGNKRLEMDGHKDGKFLIRSRADGQSFALTMSHEFNLRHYCILVSDGETYSIENGNKFQALTILVDHYHNKRDGLPCKLEMPVPNPDTRHRVWKEYQQLSTDLTQKPGHKPDQPGSKKPLRPVPPIPLDDCFPVSPSTPTENGACFIAPGSSPSLERPPPHKCWEDEEELEDQDSTQFRSLTVEEAEEQEKIYSDIRLDVMNRGLNPDQVTLSENLGSGQFGEVKKGVCRLMGKDIRVAVKTLKNNDREAESEIMKEAELMKKLDHPHIVRMIGVCKSNSLMLVLELAELGPLKKYLERHKEMRTWHLLELATQICDGMRYLEQHDVVHRDLATRNVLLLTEHFAKISDFGMSRMVDSSEYYLAHVPGKWPLMWYAPECLYYHKFDTKSDVWSFGVTLWEIMSFGARPYAHKKPPQILAFLEEGHRMAKPKDCDDRIYNIMLSCWHFQKEKRPTFAELHPKLNKLFSDFQEH
ncbi:tyrosine-protein kinase SYK [Aplysia californica]|uniref:non-specific protein-tyrosine kinase n=1 Tax=Aplysia californica TaxID=6500 RepID=A0ABM0JQA3_APLCA|nr:tyrosine-protein kinase SYK [Aplysia californica]